MIEDEVGTSLAAGQESRSQSASDHEVEELRSLAGVPAISFGATAHPPAVQVDEEDDIVDESVGDGNLDTWYHGTLLLASLILLPGSTILGDHANQLLVAGHDGWDSGNQTSTQCEV